MDFRSYQFFPECLQEIDIWLSNCARLNGRSLTPYSLPMILVYSDASSFACGGCAFRVDSEEYYLFFQEFSSLESGSDRNARELLAILYGPKSFRASLTGKVVKVFADSKNAASISAKGSNSLRLHALALEMFAYCAAHDISHMIFQFWCPGCEGVDAFSASWGGVNNYLVPPVFSCRAYFSAFGNVSRARFTYGPQMAFCEFLALPLSSRSPSGFSFPSH